MSDTVIIVDGPDEGPGAVRGDFKGGGLTDAGFEFASIFYSGLVLAANQLIGIQPNQFDALVDRNLKNTPPKPVDCNWAAWSMNEDLGRRVITAIYVLLKLERASQGLHGADEHDQACAWVQVG